MKKFANSIAILSRANGAARLVAIDTDAKTCIIDNGKEKTIKWSSAADYKLDAEKQRVLTPKLLTELYNADSGQQADEAPVNEALAAEVAPSPESVVESPEAAQDNASEEPAPAEDAGDTQEATEQPKAKRQRTPKSTISDNEKTFLSMIPSLPGFKGVDSELGARALIKKMQEVHGLHLNNGRTVFASLRNKGYYTAKGKESGQNLTTFQLTALGIQYLTENKLITSGEADEQQASA